MKIYPSGRPAPTSTSAQSNGNMPPEPESSTDLVWTPPKHGNMSADQLAHRITELEKQRAELQKKNKEHEAEKHDMVENFIGHFIAQRRRHLDEKHALEQDLRDMNNAAQMHAGVLSLDSDSEGDDDSDADNMEANRSRLRRKAAATGRSGVAYATVEDLMTTIPTIPRREDFSSSKSKKRKASKMEKASSFPICIRCYTHDLRCDPGVVCARCSQAGQDCRRAKCKNYNSGTCQITDCSRAHEKDEAVYQDHLVSAGHISKHMSGRGPLSAAFTGEDGEVPRKRTRRGKRAGAKQQERPGGDTGGGGEHSGGYEGTAT